MLPPKALEKNTSLFLPIYWDHHLCSLACGNITLIFAFISHSLPPLSLYHNSTITIKIFRNFPGGPVIKNSSYAYGCQREGWGEGIVRGFEMLYLKWIHIAMFKMGNQQGPIAQGTLFNVMWQPGWEGSLVVKGYLPMYGWIPSLLSWHYSLAIPQCKIKS